MSSLFYLEVLQHMKICINLRSLYCIGYKIPDTDVILLAEFLFFQLSSNILEVQMYVSIANFNLVGLARLRPGASAGPVDGG